MDIESSQFPRLTWPPCLHCNCHWEIRKFFKWWLEIWMSPMMAIKYYTIPRHFASNFTIIFTYILLLGDKNSHDMSDDIKWEIITISIYLSTAIIALDFAPPPNTILNFLHHLFTVWNGGLFFIQMRQICPINFKEICFCAHYQQNWTSLHENI